MRSSTFARSACAITAAAALCAVPAAMSAASGATPNPASNSPFTYAVYGDAPYGSTPTDTAEFAATPAFIANVNADPDVSTVVHVGDIHSGKQYCTRAYDQSVYNLFTTYTDPLVYTPGDNEWSDCHKVKEGGGLYNPATHQIDYVTDPVTHQPVDYAKGDGLANLALVRSIFFAHPNQTLGSGALQVLSQARAYSPLHPTDKQYVENVLWERNRTVFVTINLPGGSNNNADPDFGTPTASAAQLKEAQDRTAADLRWLDTAYAVAKGSNATSLVIVTQADMWDLGGDVASHLTNYEPVIAKIAADTKAFNKPVLLFNGDSHVYRSDNPLQQNSTCSGDGTTCAGYDAWNAHPYYNVPNFHRIVVHGSTFPLEWLKLTVNPIAHNPATPTSWGPFSWSRKIQ